MDITREHVETRFAVFNGIGLSTACGFRIFAPLPAIILPVTAFIIAATFAVYRLLQSGRVFFGRMKGGSRTVNNLAFPEKIIHTCPDVINGFTEKPNT